MNFYVDTGGNDSNDGKSIFTSVKTIAKAQELVRAAANTANDDLTVYIRGGVYTLSYSAVALRKLPHQEKSSPRAYALKGRQ